MKTFAIACLALVAGAAASELTTPVLDESLVAAINSNPKSTWTAEMSPRFQGMSIAAARKLMGTILEEGGSKLPLRKVAEPEGGIPSSFDSRTKWGKCIGGIMDQARCGSCWAFGAAEAMSDRMCIEGNGTYVQLAALDLVACDNGWINNGCQGGQPSAAWSWGQSNGLVTEKCLPYLVSEGGPIPTCKPADEPCMPPTFVNTPSCNPSCKNGASYSGDKHKLKSAYGVGSGVTAMQTELMTNGPFEVAMTVYADFVHYKSGVYSHQSGQALGGHAIKIIGWGELSGTPYWMVQNSWTTTWGDKGYFMIERGNGACGIEDGGSAGSWTS